MARRLHAARPAADADYLTVEQGMTTDRIRIGLHALAGVSSAPTG